MAIQGYGVIGSVADADRNADVARSPGIFSGERAKRWATFDYVSDAQDNRRAAAELAAKLPHDRDAAVALVREALRIHAWFCGGGLQDYPDADHLSGNNIEKGLNP